MKKRVCGRAVSGPKKKKRIRGNAGEKVSHVFMFRTNVSEVGVMGQYAANEVKKADIDRSVPIPSCMDFSGQSNENGSFRNTDSKSGCTNEE